MIGHALREAMGSMTQDALAEKSGVGQSTICQILNGKRRTIRVDTLLKLEKALGRRPGFFLSRAHAKSSVKPPALSNAGKSPLKRRAETCPTCPRTQARRSHHNQREERSE